MLRAYAERHQADPAAWRFLAGPEETPKPLVVDGFHLGMQALPPAWMVTLPFGATLPLCAVTDAVTATACPYTADPGLTIVTAVVVPIEPPEFT